MAIGDYRTCDICNNKVFYDANLAYKFPEKDKTKVYKEVGLKQPLQSTSLENLGDWAVLCLNCAKTHKVIIVKIE